MCKKNLRTMLFFLVTFGLNSSVYAQASSFSNAFLYSHAHSLNYSEASAVYQMYRDAWQDFPQTKGQYAFSRNRFVLGADFEFNNTRFTIEYIERNDLLVSFTPDTAKIFYYQAQNRKLPNDQLFDINLSAQQLAANGVRFAFVTTPWHNLSLESRVSLLNGKRFQEGDITGSIIQSLDENNKRTYQGQANIDYQYSTDKILKHRLNNPYGYGAAVDFKLNWQYQAWKLDLEVEDALQYMRWHKLGQKEGELSTQNSSTDESGFIKYDAMFSGYIINEYDYTPKRLARYSRAEISHSWSQWQLTSGIWHYYNRTFPFVSSHYQWHKSQIGLGFELNSNKVTLDYQHQRQNSTFSLVFGSNGWNPKLAHALEIQLGGRYQF